MRRPCATWLRAMTMVLTVLSSAAISMALTGLLSAQQPVFRADTEIVMLDVTVSDRRGVFLTDLTAADFELAEDGRPQQIRYFARAGDGPAPPLHVGLLFDTSGSMERDLPLARSAAIRFLNTLRDARDITLVDFDTEVRVARYGQEDFPRLVERIRSRKPEGFTALYDALGVYLDGAEEHEGRTILVIFTDGGDTRSTMRFADLLTLVRASEVTIYPIGLLQNQAGPHEQRLRLSQIARESGGEAFFPVSMKEIEEAYDRILAQVRARYHLGFVSSNETRDGAWRRITVRVTRPGLKDVRVQTRRGYFAPYMP